MCSWRVIRDGALDGAANMARDRALLDVMEARLIAGESVAPVLRLYAWDVPTVSIGRHQDPDAACDAAACGREGIPIVQRPTGGRAVLHDDELTYAVIAPAAGAFEGSGVERGAAVIARAIARGLATLGAQVQAVRGVAPSSPRAVREACFLSASRSELVVGRRKVVGSAQLRLRHALLQHGSIPLSLDAARHARVLGSSAELLARHAAGLDEALGARPAEEDVRDAIELGFANELDARLESGRLDERELSREQEIVGAWRADPLRWRAAPRG